MVDYMREEVKASLDGEWVCIVTSSLGIHVESAT